MRSLGLVFVATVLSLLVASFAWADDILLHDGHTVEATVVSSSESGISVSKSLADGGLMKYEIHASGLDPHWFYAVRNAALGENAQGRLHLALWAYENGLFNRARAQFVRVQKLDPKAAAKFKSQLVPGVRAGIARTMVSAAKDRIADGHFREAKKILSKVVTALGDTESSAAARALLPSVQQGIEKGNRLREGTVKRDANDAVRMRHQENDRHLDPVRTLVRQGVHLESRGLSAEHQTPALAAFAQAAGEFHKALRRIAELKKNHADNAELLQSLVAYYQTAGKGWIACHTNRAQIFLTRGDYSDAAAEQKEIEAFEGGGADAAQLASEIQSAQDSDGDSWYWQGDHAFGHRGMHRGRGGRRRR